VISSRKPSKKTLAQPLNQVRGESCEASIYRTVSFSREVQLKRRSGKKFAKNDAKSANHREEKVQMKMKSKKPREAATLKLVRG